MVSVEKLCKSYDDNLVLHNISLQFSRGSSVALIGPNGSGKTTLFKCILGFVFPDSGHIKLDGEDITSGPGYRKQLGYMPQISKFPDQMKVISLFDLIGSLRPDVSPGQYDLSLYEDYQLESIKDRRLGDLSGGMRQQVSAALAFLLDPSIVILDEPTAGLDPLSNQLLKDKIRNIRNAGEKIVLATSHNLYDLEEICDHIIYLMKGQIVINESISDLKRKTSRDSLSKIIVSILKELELDQDIS